MSTDEIMERLLKEVFIPLHILEANRKCPFGGGCKDCPCKGDCPIKAK